MSMWVDEGGSVSVRMGIYSMRLGVDRSKEVEQNEVANEIGNDKAIWCPSHVPR